MSDPLLPWVHDAVKPGMKFLQTRAIAKVLVAFPGAKLLPELRHGTRGRRCRKCGWDTWWCTRERVHLHPACAGY